MAPLDREYYVYFLLDPRKPGIYTYQTPFGELTFNELPFYVGKGFGDRCYHHYTRKTNLGNRNRMKANTVKKILSEGKEPTVIKYYTVDKQTALDYEQQIIATLGRRDLKTGILVNRTDGGQRGLNPIIYPEIRQRISQTMKSIGLKAANRKLIYQYTLSGDFVKEWDCIMCAAGILGMNHPNISRAVIKESPSGGYFWYSSYLGEKIQVPEIKVKKPRYVPVLIYDLKLNFIIRAESALEASKYLKCHKNYVTAALQKKRCKTVKGHLVFRETDQIPTLLF